jgi:hypothetical protein
MNGDVRACYDPAFNVLESKNAHREQVQQGWEVQSLETHAQALARVKSRWAALTDPVEHARLTNAIVNTF